MQRTAAAAMTLIEIKPHGWGWKVFEALGVEPVLKEKITQSIMRRAARAFALADSGVGLRRQA
jgi:hypothetical protein